jgi:DNA mismatch repair protein MutH
VGLRPTTLWPWVLEREGERNIPVSERVVGDEMERVIRERERKIKLDGASVATFSDVSTLTRH